MSFLTVDGPKPSTSSEKSDYIENEDLEVDNSQSVLLKIANLYAEQLMSDLVLEVGGVDYSAHRLILCASSEVFQVMLMNREWNEWRESKIVLQETPTAASVFPHFLKYFYTGQIKISYNTVLPVLSLADKYNVKDLVSLCLEYMSQHIALAAKKGQVINWMQYTMACGHTNVAKACQNFVKWNMEWVWSHADLSELEDETLLLLLQQSDLVLHNECSLYRFTVDWLHRQKQRFSHSEENACEWKQHWETLVTTVFSHIRFPMMCPSQLAKLLLCSLTQEYKEFFMEQMAIAMSYQSGQYERVAEIQESDHGRMLFTPRLYTEDIWGSILGVDNFHSLPCYHTRTFIFSTRPSVVDVAPERLSEWTVDLYPKGVWFKKSMLIAWSGTYDVPEVVLRTVRISITCQSCPDPVTCDFDCEEDVRVKVGVLVWGVQNGVEHVASVVERIHRFSSQNRVLNVDGALDFDELNTPLYTPAVAASPLDKPSGRCLKCTENCDAPEPKHLLGPNRDQLRIQVVIVPLTDFCHVSAPDG
ncbi:unnamed protein product [Pieris macdunnoughi]|uniref:BTB domain-containing protein n=1 Tax=Pieris macdunnoughi TaxID=345717 RepID=A0A821Q5C2_9NEOP|nr:unnamed protein product [Pieris macdunnoughi]